MTTAWKDVADAWVEVQALLGDLARPHERLLAETARVAQARTVLDVGCGTGGATLAVARALGPDAHVTGLDVAEPMLAAARERAAARDDSSAGAAAVDLVRGDAQTHPFAPGAYDFVVSRCGVMFFDDPVAAFANLRAATDHGGGLRFVAWRSADENPFMTAAERAARPLLAPDLLPQRTPDAPGQFAFANERFVRGVLEGAGWEGVKVRELDTPCVFPEAQLMPYVTRVGAVANVLLRLDDATRARVLEAVREAFAPFVHGGEVRYTARMWDVGATNPHRPRQP